MNLGAVRKGDCQKRIKLDKGWQLRIFVGYHYGPGDAWVRKHIYGLVEAFGDKVDSGENLYLTPALSEGVIDKVQACDALIGVASRSAPAAGFYTTHPWVQQELTVARAANKLFVQLRETQIDPHLGILEGAQYIEYDRTDLAPCLVKLAGALSQWHSLRNVPITFLPSDFADAVTLVLKDAVCTLELLDQDYQRKNSLPLKIDKTPGAVVAVLRGIPRDSLIRIEVAYGKDKWTSDVVNFEAPTIMMRRS